MNNIENQLINFLKINDDSDSIDDLVQKDKIKSQFADYFFNNKKIICEQKILKSDMTIKIKKELHQILKEKGGLFYGELPLQSILKKFNESEELNKRLYLRLAKTIDNLFEKAEKQILSTKNIFNLNDSKGVLLIINEISNLFSPEIITQRLSELFNKRDKNGKIRYQNICCAWILSKTHHITNIRNLGEGTVYPSIFLENNFSYSKDSLQNTLSYMTLFGRRFMNYMNIPVIIPKNDEVKNVQIKTEPDTMPKIDL